MLFRADPAAIVIVSIELLIVELFAVLSTALAVSTGLGNASWECLRISKPISCSQVGAFLCHLI